MSRIWTLTIDVSGRRLYLATEPCAPVATLDGEDWRAGASVTHLPILAIPSCSWRALPGGSTVGDRSVSVSFLLPSDLSLADLEAGGQTVERVRGELAIWWTGAAYEARVVVAAGWLEIDALTLGGEEITATLLNPEPTSTATIPLAEDEINDANLNPYTIVVGGSTVGFSMGEDVQGTPYPIPLGRPGLWVDETGASAAVPSCRANLITQAVTLQRMLIAGRQVGATGMTIWNATATGVVSPTYVGTVSTIYDGRGQVCSTVDVSGASAYWALDGSEEFYCLGWADGVVLDNGERVRGLGDAALYLLRLADADGTFDLGRWEAARSALNTIEIGGFVETPVLPWEILTSDLLPLFPRCVVMPGNAGLYPVIFEDAHPTDGIELIEGIDFELPEGARPSPATDGGVSAVRLSYAYNALSEEYLATVVFGPRTDDQTESGHGSARRAWGWDVGGSSTRTTTIMESPWLWAHDSAERVADDVLRLGVERLPSLALSLLDLDRWRSLPIGLPVRVTAPTVGWDKRPCWICGLGMAALDELEVLARPR